MDWNFRDIVRHRYRCIVRHVRPWSTYKDSLQLLMVQRWCAWSRLISCMLWLQYWCGSYLTKFQQNLRRMVTLLGMSRTRTEQELQQQVKEIHNKDILKTWKQVVTVAFQLTNWRGHTFGMDSIELRPERRPRIVNLAGFALERLGWRRQFREQPQQLQQLHKTKKQNYLCYNMKNSTTEIHLRDSLGWCQDLRRRATSTLA